MTTKSAKILIVEDEPVVKLHLKTCLENLGYLVLPPVSSHCEALTSLKREKPNLVLMDIILEGELDGIHTADKINSNFGVPVVFLTAYSDDATLSRARACQPYGYIVKPFREEDLKTAIEIALFKSEQEINLKENVDFNTSLLDSIEYPVMALSCDEIIIFLNSHVQSLMGKENSQILGKEFREVVKLLSENGDKMEIPFDRILVKGDAEEFNDISLVISEEKTRLVDIAVSPFKKESNRVIGSVLVFKDITENSLSREDKEAFLDYLTKLMDG